MNTEIILKRGKHPRIISGHPWIYGNEIERVKSPFASTYTRASEDKKARPDDWSDKASADESGDESDYAEARPPARAGTDGDDWSDGASTFAKATVDRSSDKSERGEIVDVKDDRGKFIGRGYFNPKSQIAVRLLSRNQKEDINEDFFRRKILSCYEYRKKIGYTENFRLVFGEGDFLPGLIIDKFGDVFVMQTLSLGMDHWKDVIVAILKKEFAPRGIYERNDVPVRKLEGLEEQKGFLTEPFPTKFEIEESGVKLLIDIGQGQKTGFFLDQKENRLMLRHIGDGAEVLDCFCYTGSFAMFAAKFGAKKVTALDASEEAIQLTKENASLNGFESVLDYQVGNAFDMLPQWVKEKKSFDVVILDPPAFTKSRSGVDSAARGYKEINLRAMKLIRSGGFLLTFSCSHFMDPSMFFDVASQAAMDAGKTIRQVAFLTQAKDHPVVWNIPETNYLKGFLLQVI